jgi:transposase InsO family protein
VAAIIFEAIRADIGRLPVEINGIRSSTTGIQGEVTLLAIKGKFRAECLNAYWFLSLDDARLKCEAWRRDYNEVRPHSAIGNQTPVARAFASGQAGLT